MKTVAQQKAAQSKSNKEPTTTNLNFIKTIKQAKKKDWQNYVNHLDSSKNKKANTIWKIILKNQQTYLKYFMKNNTEATEKTIADNVAETFGLIFSHKNANSLFLAFKNNAEKHSFNFILDNSERYNKPFI